MADYGLMMRQGVNWVERNVARPLTYSVAETAGCVERKATKALESAGRFVRGSDEQQTDAGKATQNSMRANLRHNLEDVERIYEQPKQNKHGQQASLDNVHDSFAFSPEALALMG